MVAPKELVHQAFSLKSIFFNADESEILEHADELLLFLNRLRDVHRPNAHGKTLSASMDDIIHGLESNPELTLHKRTVRERLLNLFMKF
jgi:hypothetical protein